jgi:hypothetical protein
VPNVMGNALRLHPLIVIVALLGGGEVYGLPGALVALPLAAALRATWEFFGGRLEREPWPAGSAVPVVEGEALLPPLVLEPDDTPKAVAREADPPADPPAAAAG